MNIEDYITSKKEAFNDNEPFEGHHERFMRKLQASSTSNKKGMMYSWVAASIIFALSTAYVTGLFVLQHNTTTKTGEEIYPVEFLEYEKHYFNLISEKKDVIKDMNDNLPVSRLYYDLNKLDASYRQLKKDYVKHPYDKRIIETMVYHLRVQLEILDQIINQLKSENTKNKNYENNV